MNWLQRITHLLVDSPIRPVVRPIYNTVIHLELAMQRQLDRLTPAIKDSSSLDSLTAVVKTFERPAVLARLLESIRRRYPSLHVIVVDDSLHPVPVEGVEYITLPYDSGVSLGRSVGLQHVQTPYALILDDDFILYRHTQLHTALHIMEQHSRIDILGGSVVNLPFFYVSDYSKFSKVLIAAKHGLEGDYHIGGLPIYVKVPNFFIARTERLRLVDWDPALKRLDHAVFFRRAYNILTTVFFPTMKCLHAQSRFDRHYMAKRSDVTQDVLESQRYFNNKL